MQKRRLGRNGPEVSAIGLGCMGMTEPPKTPCDEKECIATIHAALDAGINFLNTGDFYGSGRNETLIAKALKDRREQITLSVKTGGLREPNGTFIGHDLRPESVKNFISYSLQRLQTNYIDIYQPARRDPDVPIEDTVGAIKDLIDAGYVRYLGLSEMSAETVRKANDVHPVAALETEYSLVYRRIEATALPVLRELGIGLVPYGVLTHGLLTGRIKSVDDPAAKALSFFPQFHPENLRRNLKLVETLKKLAADKNITPSQLVIAWVLAKGNDIVPVIGVKRRESLTDTLAALEVSLTGDDIDLFEKHVPEGTIAGDRYPPEQMAVVDL
jgi:aryl-alcohol dehydrogenase-like predicted oxidoreductase